MGTLIIYCEHIKSFINVVFVVNFFHLAILFFKNKTFVLVLIFSTFSPFFVVDTKNLLWHPWSMTKQIWWSQCEMQWNMPFIPITPNFLKLQLEFQTSYMNLISIHISFLKFFILKWKIYTLILNIFIWIWKFISQLWNYYFNLKQWFSIM